MPKNLAWTDDEDRALRKMHAGGISAREIAEWLVELGFPVRSRNAVIGRLNRLNLSVARKRKSPDRSRGIPAVGGSMRHCQWPLWQGKPDGRYCGKSVVPGRPYCGDHAARAYVGSKEDHRKSWEVAAG